MPELPTDAPKRLAVVGAGPAGLAFAVTAARRGHQVTLFDAAAEIGGQFNIAKQIPGKEEFYETLRYFRRQLVLNGVTLQLNTLVQVKQLAEFDEVILACGIQPRLPCINGIDHPKVLTYLDVLRDKKPVGQRVAIIGAGGIGFDTAEYLSQSGDSPRFDSTAFSTEWGIDQDLAHRGAYHPRGLKSLHPHGRFSCYNVKPAKSVKGWVKPPVGSTAPAWRCAASRCLTASATRPLMIKGYISFVRNKPVVYLSIPLLFVPDRSHDGSFISPYWIWEKQSI